LKLIILSLKPEFPGDGPEPERFFKSQPEFKGPLGRSIIKPEPFPGERFARGRGVSVEEKGPERGRQAQTHEVPGPAEASGGTPADPVRIEKKKVKNGKRRRRPGVGRFLFQHEDISVGKIAMDESVLVQSGKDRRQIGNQTTQGGFREFPEEFPDFPPAAHTFGHENALRGDPAAAAVEGGDRQRRPESFFLQGDGPGPGPKPLGRKNEGFPFMESARTEYFHDRFPVRGKPDRDDFIPAVMECFGRWRPKKFRKILQGGGQGRALARGHDEASVRREIERT
jgi:hypothetical protein